MGIVCGNCETTISDVGTCNMGVLFTDPDMIEDTWEKCIQVYECHECGALTMLWTTWGDKDHVLVYKPDNGKDNEIMNIRSDEYRTTRG